MHRTFVDTRVLSQGLCRLLFRCIQMQIGIKVEYGQYHEEIPGWRRNGMIFDRLGLGLSYPAAP